MKRLRVLLPILFLLLPTLLVAQNISSSVKGVVVDPSGARLAGASITLTNEATATTATTAADATGEFTFTNVLPGTYTLKVDAAGFRTLTLTKVAVEASQIRTLGDISLQIGATADVVAVTAEAAQMQLASAEKSGVVTGDQLDRLALKGRDIFSVLATIPGVVDTGAAGGRVISMPTQIAGTSINGGRDSQKNFNVDGITDLDTGSNQTVHFTTSPDAIQEVKILTSNYQAEYGRSAGGTINVITKSGTQRFHGTGYYYGRNESLNAMSWDAHHYKTKKDIERAGVEGFSLGGPLFIPGALNTKKDKLFFFVSEEWSHWRQPAATRIVTVPTNAERNGDFSQSLDSTGSLIRIIDPTTGLQFPGNQIPQARWSAMGQNILNFFPQPNYTNPLGAYRGNYISQFSGNYNRRSDMFRVDANITPTLTAYFRFNHDLDEQNQPWGNWVTSMNWLLTNVSFNQPGYGYTGHLVKVFSPTLVNDFSYGYSHNHLLAVPSDASKWARSQLGIPEWFPDSSYLPNIAFGGRHYTPANISVIGSFPYENFNDIYSIVDNVSKVAGKHTMKAGIYVERTGKLSPLWTTYRGSLSFAHSTLNPLNTTDGFANALLGVVTSYSESTQGGSGDWWFNNIEWYLQDNWKIASRLTLDYGIRFYHMGPVVDHNHKMATFNPALYNPANAPRLFVPAMNGTTRVGYDPVTGIYVPAVAIGALVPGSGDVNNGSCAAGQNGCPEGLAGYSAIDFGPRFGLAYDVFGTGKTVLHLGAGEFKDRGSILPPVYAAGSPPVGYTSTAYYTTLDQLSNATGFRFPSGGWWTSGAWAFYGRMKTPTVVNYSASIQQKLPSSIVLEVGYVGNVARHTWVNVNVNPIQVGARFNPANADPTTGGVLPDNFMRVYPGYTDVTAQQYTGTANYNALQVSANRRIKSLQFGVAYTWSKALGVASGDGDYISSYLNPRAYNYGPLAQDRTQSLVVNYWYDLPKLGKKYDLKPLGWFIDDWSISGITSFISGAPLTPAITWSDYRDVTGSSDGSRGQLIGSPFANIPSGLNFNPAAFAPTPRGSYGNVSFGNVPFNLLRGPGINNWDMTLAKHIPLGSEQRYLQFKAEAFNLFNHTQYSSYDGTLVFNAAGVQTNNQAGIYNHARDPRKLQFGVKLYF